MTNMSEQEKRIELIKSDLGNFKGLTESNRKDILRFFNHQDAKGRSPTTLIKCWDRIKLLIGYIPDKDFRDFTKDDFEAVLAEMRKKYSEWSIVTAQKVFRAFWRYLYGREKDERAPDAVRWFEISEPPNGLTKGDLLTKQERDAIMASTNNLMQKALLSILCAGARPGEILGMTLKDVYDEKELIKIYAREGKMKKKIGQRPIFVLEYADCLRAWISSHPDKGNKDAALLVTNKGPLLYRNLNMIVKRLGEKAGISRRVWPYLFRHGYATMVYTKHGASHGRRLMGHKTLKQERVYVHLDEADLEDELLGKKRKREDDVVNKRELEIERKRQILGEALNRREDLKRELVEEMRQIIMEEIRRMM